MLRQSMRQAEHQATRRNKLRTRRPGESGRAPGDLEDCAKEFAMMEFP